MFKCKPNNRIIRLYEISQFTCSLEDNFITCSLEDKPILRRKKIEKINSNEVFKY